LTEHSTNQKRTNLAIWARFEGEESVMGDIRGLGYLGLTGSIDEWRSLADILGLEALPQTSDSEARFRIDERAWRIAVQAGAPGLGYIGWEIGSRAALSRVRAKLEAAGFSLESDPELARARGVLELFRCKDPSGLPLEFFFGAEVSQAPFQSPTGARFVTGSAGKTLGLGHVVLFVDDAKATTEFYLGLLGFELSDSIISGYMGATFTHTNPRHHSLAFGAARGAMKRGLEHFMLEVDSLDAVGRALDRVTKSGVPVTVTLGKHSNDLMTSFYLRTPSGCDLEYGVGGRLLDDAWIPTWFRSPSIWGHQRVPLAADTRGSDHSKSETSGQP
jgi:3,4-dihydroxy-9,10-secoandrosta-1,3,5(10)-triene-9,17-dione 4,5-dioxygenase